MKIIIALLVGCAPAIAYGETCARLAEALEKANLADASNEKLVAQVVDVCTADKGMKSARPFISAGTFYVRQKKASSAIPVFREALTREPDLPLAWIDLSAAYMDMNKFDDAIEAASHALTAADTHMRAMANHNDGLARFKKMAASKNFSDTSSEEFFKAAVALEKIPDAWFYIGMVEQFQKNNAAEGQKYFKLACDAGHQGACAQLKK